MLPGAIVMLLVVLAGCAHQKPFSLTQFETVDEAQLMELRRAWPHSERMYLYYSRGKWKRDGFEKGRWSYIGSKAGYHYFHFDDVGRDRRDG